MERSFSQITSLEEIYANPAETLSMMMNGNFLEVQQGMTDIMQCQLQEQWYFDNNIP